MASALPRPRIITTVAELRGALDGVRRKGKRIGLVPTMGALHEGHMSLVRTGLAECDYTVVTIFVNPSQFGPQEDFRQYPRTLQSDLDALSRCGVPLVFAPPEEEVYPAGFDTWVEVGAAAARWEGECRPGHFRGVTTVVLKLLNMAGPHVAYFGQKDYQQALVIRRMVEDLNVPTEIRVCPTVREPDGLAMSSRNSYLGPDARRRALVLWKSLSLAADLVAQGERDAAAVGEKMRDLIRSAEGVQVEYAVLVAAETLEPVDRIDRRTLAALAVRIDDVRLIDNRLIDPPS